MRIFELERIPDYKVEKDWPSFTRTAYWIKDDYTNGGEYAGLSFRIYENQGMVRIAGFQEQIIQAYLTLMRADHGYHVQAVQVASAYRGQGIAVHMYELALQQGLTIISDYQQTSGGSAIWKRLSREPSVRVDTIDLHSGKPIQMDPFDSHGFRYRAQAA